MIGFFGGLIIPRGVEVAMGCVWSCTHCVGNVWLTIFVGCDVGAIDFAGMAGCAVVLPGIDML